MDKKYLIPIKNGFLVYQPESDTVYRGRRKTAGLNFALTVPFWMAIITPILEFVADYLWPFLDYSGYRIIKYTLLMTIFGIIYYKYVYTKNKIKLLQSQLESVKISDIKEEIFKDTIETFIVSIIGGMFFFCVSFFAVINMDILDTGGRLAAIVCYTIIIPMLIIEGAFKGRFLLLKHLLQLNKAE